MPLLQQQLNHFVRDSTWRISVCLDTVSVRSRLNGVGAKLHFASTEIDRLANTRSVDSQPQYPKLGQPERTFSQVNIPWMLMTGTKDDSPIGDQSAESRLNVFPALPAGQKYQVVFDGGTHAFLVSVYVYWGRKRNRIPTRAALWLYPLRSGIPTCQTIVKPGNGSTATVLAVCSPRRINGK